MFQGYPIDRASGFGGPERLPRARTQVREPALKGRLKQTLQEPRERFQSSVSMQDGCDLRLLAKHLSPEEDLREVRRGNIAIKQSSFGRATLGVLFRSRMWLGPGTSCSRRSPPKSTRATSRRVKTTELASTLFLVYPSRLEN